MFLYVRKRFWVFMLTISASVPILHESWATSTDVVHAVGGASRVQVAVLIHSAGLAHGHVVGVLTAVCGGLPVANKPITAADTTDAATGTQSHSQNF